MWFEWRRNGPDTLRLNPAPLEHQLVLYYPPSKEERDQEEDQEYPEQSFCNPGCCFGKAGKAQKCSCHCDDQEED